MEVLAVPVVVARVTWTRTPQIKLPVARGVLTVQTVVQESLLGVPVKALLPASSAKLPGNCMRAAAEEVPVSNTSLTLKLELEVKAVAVLAAKMLLELLALKTPEVVAVEVLRAGTTTQFVYPAPVAAASCA